MAWAGAPSLGGLGSTHVQMDGLEAGVRSLDPGSRALLDLSLRRRLRDDDMAPLLRIDAFNLAWRRARAIERLASGLGLVDPAGLAQVRAALPHLPASAWCLPLALEPGPAPRADSGAAAPESEPETVEGEAITMEFDALPAGATEPGPGPAPEHAWGPRALALRPSTPPFAGAAPAAPVVPPRFRAAISAARTATVARPAATRGALLAGAGALIGALLSRRRR